MKVSLLFAFATLALAARAQQTVYFNPDTIATDISVWEEGKIIIPSDFPDFLGLTTYGNPEKIWPGYDIKPAMVGITAKGEPVTVRYNHVTHRREIKVGDRLLFADNEVKFYIPGHEDEGPLLPSVINCNKIKVTHGNRSAILSTAAADFESQLLAAVAPRKDFTREGYCYCFRTYETPDDLNKSYNIQFDAYTIDLPADPKLKRSVLNILGKYYIPNSIDKAFPVQNDLKTTYYEHVTYFYAPDRMPRDFRDAVSLMQAAKLATEYYPGAHSVICPSDTIPRPYAHRSTTQLTPVLHKDGILTYKESCTSTYYAGGGFQASTKYLSFDLKNEKVLESSDIFGEAAGSPRLKEVYVMTVQNYLENANIFYGETNTAQKKRQATINRLKYGDYKWKSGNATIDDIEIPSAAAVTEEGVRILLPAEVFSDFGETPDEYILIPWSELKGLSPFAR